MSDLSATARDPLRPRDDDGASRRGPGPGRGGHGEVGRGREHRRRGRYLAILAVLLGLVLTVSLASQWWLYRAVKAQMDELIGDRLVTVGTVVARSVGWDGVLELSVTGTSGSRYAETRRTLREIAEQNDLDGLTLIDADRRVLVGVGSSAEPGRIDPALELEPALTDVFLTASPRTSALARVAISSLPDQYLKAGYAPIVDPEGLVVGAVVVEGGSEFFQVLAELRSRLLFSAGLGLLAVLALGSVFFLTLRALIRLEDSLRGTAALAAIGQIASVVAHEIKNPLAIIRSRAERVRAKIAAGKEPEEILEWFEVIPAEVDRLNDIVTNYLSLARPERAGEGTCRVETVVREIAELLRHDLERRGIALRIQVDSEIEASIGARSLKQILLNLVLNGADAIESAARTASAEREPGPAPTHRAEAAAGPTAAGVEPGGTGGRITISAQRRSSRWIEVRVADTGKGMTAEERSRILEPFFTTKPTGSGLGLTLVESLVRGRGGRLELESRRGAGTEVFVVLPAAERA